MSQPNAQTLTVTAEKAQYCLESSPSRNNDWPAPHNSLATGEENWTAVLTGTQYGPVTVRIAVLDGRPAGSAPGWGMIVEQDIVSGSGEISVKNITDPNPVQVLRLSPGRYRLRIHARGRVLAQFRGGDLAEAVETHLIQVWPTMSSEPPIVLVGPDEVRRGNPVALYPGAKLMSVLVEHGQYRVEASDGCIDPWPAPKDALTTGEDNWIAVLTGTQFGPLTIQAVVLDSRPTEVDSGWDLVGERDLVAAGGRISIKDLFASRPVYEFNVAPGRYRLRIHARGLAMAQPHGHLGAPLEDHLLQLWPTTEETEPAVWAGTSE